MLLNKKDLLYLAFICLILLLIIKIGFFSFGNLLYDCGRELLVPKLINEGYIPIKDIFLTYPPLSYQLNAVFFKISNSINTLRIVGTICSLLTGIFIYLCSRNFATRANSFKITLAVVFITMFNVSYLYNYIFAYSYAFIYAMPALFASVFFALRFLKEEKFLYPSFFCLGLLFALKFEFIFLIIPYLILLFYKKVSKKQCLIAVLLSILPLFLSFCTLFIKGFNIIDLKNYLIFLTTFMKSPILKTYTSNITTTSIIDWLIVNFTSFLKFLLALIITKALFFVSYKNKILKILAFIFLFIIFFALSLFFNINSASTLFSWLCVSSLVIFIFEFKKQNFPLKFLILIQFFLAIRFNFIYQGGYLAYIMPIALLANQIFFDKKFKTVMTCIFAISCVNVFYFALSQKVFPSYEIKSPFGKMLVIDPFEAKTINSTISFLDKLPKDAYVLSLPDGAIFNYMADKKTSPKYYQLLPNHIEALSEEIIVSDIKQNAPDYVLTTNSDYSIYGVPKFCKDFGTSICSYVDESYDLIKTIASDSKKDSLEIKIYKKR